MGLKVTESVQFRSRGYCAEERKDCGRVRLGVLLKSGGMVWTTGYPSHREIACVQGYIAQHCWASKSRTSTADEGRNDRVYARDVECPLKKALGIT